MVAMYRQSLDRPSTGLPPSIGLDARRLWRAGPAAGAAGKGNSPGAAPASAAAAAAGGAATALPLQSASAMHEPLPPQDSEPAIDAPQPGPEPSRLPSAPQFQYDSEPAVDAA